MQSYNQNLPLNQLIGKRYRVQSVLGEGGFGITYKAWDEKLRRHVVIKEYLPSELGIRDRDSLKVLPRSRHETEYRFGLQKYLEEAVTLAKFNHPHIVQILDHLEDNGTAYIVMKFEEGETLSQHLKRAPLHEADILSLLPPLLDGLHQVHQAGLLHRDIKPGNIFLREQGGPLLIDFGAARHALGEETKSLSAIVSLGYAPPEQYSARSKQGPWTDLYGFGAVLYELISGQAPIESIVRAYEGMEGRVDPMIPACQVGQGRFSEQLLRLTDQLLAIQSHQRPQSCQAALRLLEPTSSAPVDATLQLQPPLPVAALEPALPMANPSPAAPPPRPAVHWPWVLLALVTLSGGAAYLANAPPPEPASKTATAAADIPPTQAPEPTPTQPRKEPPPPIPMTGQLQLNVDAPNARVWLDGQEIGNAGPNRPLNQEGLSTGGHRIRIEAEGRQPWEGQVEINRGEWRQVAAQLKPVEEAKEYRDPTSGMEFIKIEGGSFQMGSPAGEKDRDSDEKQHRVSVGDFYLAKHEVTFAQYDRFAQATGRVKPGDEGWGRGERPVINVDWNDATAYAEWLSRESGKKYRLPTEAEWEYAARAGTTGPFSTGRCINTDQANYNGNYDYNDCGAKTGTYRQKTLPVGSLAANPWGLYDMHGNVWEWTCSAYDSDYGGSEQQCSSKNDATVDRTLRGGSWINEPWVVRSADRYGDDAAYRINDSGFRLARIVSP